MGENIAKGSISDSSSTVNSRNSILFLKGKTENSIAGEALVVAGGSRLSKNYRSGEFQPSKIRMNPRAQWNEKAWNYTDWQ